MATRGSCTSYEIIEIKDHLIILFGCDARVIFELMHNLSTDWVPHVDKDIVIQPYASAQNAPPCPHQLNFDTNFTFWCVQTQKIRYPCWLALRADVNRSLFSRQSRSWARKVQVEVCASDQGKPAWGPRDASVSVLNVTPAQIQVHQGELTPDLSRVSDPSICPPSVFLHPNADALAESRLMNTFLPQLPLPSAVGRDVPFQGNYLSDFGIEASVTQTNDFHRSSPIALPATSVETREVDLIGPDSPASHSQNQGLGNLTQADQMLPQNNAREKMPSGSKPRRARKSRPNLRHILPGPV